MQLPAGVGCCLPLSPTVPTAALPARCRHTAGGGGVSTGERAPAGLPAECQPRPQKRLCREAGARRSGSLPRGCGQQEEGTAGEEALPVSGEIYHWSLSCRSSCSSLSPLLLRATCPRMQVTTSRRARSVRGERLLQQQGQSLPDPAAGTVLPLPAPTPHLRGPVLPHSPLEAGGVSSPSLAPAVGSHPAHSHGCRNTRAPCAAPWLRGWLPVPTTTGSPRTAPGLGWSGLTRTA